MAVDQINFSSPHLISDVDVSMDLKCCKPILPDPLQMEEAHILPLLHTVNDLQLQVLHPTGSKMNSKFCRPVLHLTPMATMPHMHVIDTFSCVLLVTQPT